MEIDPFRDRSLVEYSQIPPKDKFIKLFNKFDLYALPITLKFNGEKKFYTTFGAMTSIFLIVVMLNLLGT
jgi:hypothetical protein